MPDLGAQHQQFPYQRPEPRRPRKSSAIVIALVLAMAGFGFWLWQRDPVPTQATEDSGEVIEEPGVKVEYELREVREDDTFTDIMEDLGVSYADALAIVEGAADVFDFTNVKLGKQFRLVKEDGVPMRIEYEPGTEYMVVIDLQDGFKTEKRDIEYDVELATAELTVTNSLYTDGIEAGLSDELIIAFAEVFAWEIDFATVVQEGDRMTVLYEKRFRNGEEAGIGNVLAGTFTNNGNTVAAYYFEGSNDKAGYYDEEGNSLIRPFLKAPLDFRRISSGFSYARFDPITGAAGTHRAIDYAAALGTPIRAVGDGTITRAGWNGPYGNFISIHHNDRYSTNYAHLSKFAPTTKPGARVKQGDIIGYVGSTGHSTGPHLHYEVLVDGVKTNPSEVVFPKGDTLEEDQKAAFSEERDRLKGLLP